MTTLRAVIESMRPRQWIKNVFVFAALVFTHQIANRAAVLDVAAGFVIFCMISSAVYLINDITDREADRQHPGKRNRPIAAGRLSATAAGLVAAALVIGALLGALVLNRGFAAIAIVYLLMNLLYSLGLKQVVIVDVMLVAAGFLLRAWAGAVILDVEMSQWLVLCTGLLALFLGFVKRRQEIASLGPAGAQRPILKEYSLPFLDQMIAIVTAGTLLAYSLYAFSDEVAQKLGSQWMGLTIPFVLFGIFRYLYLAHQQGKGENPTTLVLTDRPLQVTVLLWGGTVLLVLYAL